MTTAYTITILPTNTGLQTNPISSVIAIVNSDSHADAYQALLDYINNAVNLQTLAIATISP